MQSEGARAAKAVAEAIRQLNHATIAGRGYGWPSDVDATIAQLQVAAGRFRQALGQADAWLARAHAAGMVGHDGEDDPGATLGRLSRTFEDAASTADQLERELNAVRADTNHLTGQLPCQPLGSSGRDR